MIALQPLRILARLLTASAVLLVTSDARASRIFGLISDQTIPIETTLYSFNADGSDFTNYGVLQSGDIGIEADGLAVSPNHGLCAFQIDESGSRLISLQPNSATATVIGVTLPGRRISGAVFGIDDQLWTVDSMSDELLRIDPTTGAIVASPVNLTIPRSDDFASGIERHHLDLAVRDDNTMYLVVATDGMGPNAATSKVFSLDTLSGSLTEIHSDSVPDDDFGGPILSGATFSKGANAWSLFVADSNNDEDVFRYDLDALGVPRTTVVASIPVNAGTGDLAALIPEPSTARLAICLCVALALPAIRRWIVYLLQNATLRCMSLAESTTAAEPSCRAQERRA